MTQPETTPRPAPVAPPTHVLLMLTYRCNLRCPYCLVFDPVRYWAPDATVAAPPATAEREMTGEEIVGRVLPECERAGVGVMAVTGGEIMLRRDFGMIADGLGRSRLDWCMDTNLSRCTDQLAEAVIDARCDTVFVSMDGPEETHNRMRASKRAFAQATAGLDRVLHARRAAPESRTKIIANCVLQAGNEHVPPQLVGWAADLGLDAVSFQFLSAQHYTPGFASDVAMDALDEARAFGEQLGIRVATFPLTDPTEQDLVDWYTTPPAGAFFTGCDYIHSSARIDPAGNVIPCVENRMGNILKQDLLDIWTGPRYTAFRNQIATRPLAACARCCNLTVGARG